MGSRGKRQGGGFQGARSTVRGLRVDAFSLTKSVRRPMAILVSAARWIWRVVQKSGHGILGRAVQDFRMRGLRAMGSEGGAGPCDLV